VANTYKVRLATKEETHESKCHEWEVEYDAAVAILHGQLDIKKTEAFAERSKALTATCNFATESKQLKRVEDLCQHCKDYDDVISLLCTTKPDVMRLKKELTTKVNEQLEKQQAHMEHMQDTDMEQETIKAEKLKDNNYTKLLAKDRKHANVMVRTKRCYDKAESSNLL
jgi:hypothetical protein